MTLTKLAPLLVQLGETQAAQRLAAAAQTQSEAFGLWAYSAYLVPMQTAVAQKQEAKSMELISKMLEAVLVPWDVRTCPLCRDFPAKEPCDTLGTQMLRTMLKELEKGEEYAFLRKNPDFIKLLKAYHAKCEEVNN